MSRALGLHHAAKRHASLPKRVIKAIKSPSNFDKAMVGIAVIYPLTMIPQILRVIELQDASSLSWVTFSAKIFLAIPWIYYGFLHKSKPVIFSNVLWIVSYAVVLAQIAMY